MRYDFGFLNNIANLSPPWTDMLEDSSHILKPPLWDKSHLRVTMCVCFLYRSLNVSETY